MRGCCVAAALAEVLFPGFVTTVFGILGVWMRASLRRGEVVAIYGGAAALAIWASFGPVAGLYTLLYDLVPAFPLLRAPSGSALIADFGLAILAGVAIAALLHGRRHGSLIAAALTVVAVGGSDVPLQWPRGAAG